MSTLNVRLYRALIQKARHFDKNPGLKALIKDLDTFEPLKLRTLYSPCMQKSFVQVCGLSLESCWPKLNVGSFLDRKSILLRR